MSIKDPGPIENELRCAPCISLFAFLLAVWAAEKGMVLAKGSPLLGQIVAGIVCGPALLDFVPHTSALELLGLIGVMLMVVEGGLSVDVDEVRRVGARAFLMAAAGVAAPVGLAMMVVCSGYGRTWKVGLSIGAALAPTSLGFSAALLNEHGRLQTPQGQLIATAAVVDDVLSLALLAEVQALSGDSATAWDVVRPVLASLGSIAVGAALVPLVSRHYPSLVKGVLEGLRWRVDLAAVLSLAVVMAWVSAVVGSSSLLGCFVAGLGFSPVPGIHDTWQSQTKRPGQWLARLFFAATIGFGVPEFSGAGNPFGSSALGMGALLSLCAVAGKLVCGAFARPMTPLAALTLGFAMNGRGEFSFLIADEAAEEGIVPRESADYAATIWALLASSLVAPVAFRMLLAREGPDVEGSGAERGARKTKGGVEGDGAGGGAGRATLEGEPPPERV